MAGILVGKVAVVTGRTSGMSVATATLFAREGARVFITGRRRAEPDKAVAVIGFAAKGVQADASQLADLARSMRRCERRPAASTCCSPMPAAGRLRRRMTRTRSAAT